jgi:ferritin
MLIPKPILEMLNNQIAGEFQAAHNYMRMACVLDGMGLKMLSQWFFRQGEEERNHGKKILHYVLETGGDVKLQAVKEPTGDVSSALAIVQSALDQEISVTRAIHDIAAASEQHKDYSTRSFLGWFIDEQVEEVSSMTDLLHLVKMAGEHNLLAVEERVARLLEQPAKGE